MTESTIESHELALTLINTNDDHHLFGLESQRKGILNWPRTLAASRWVEMAQYAARRYEREGGGAPVFTVEDILLAAIELHEHYHSEALEDQDGTK